MKVLFRFGDNDFGTTFKQVFKLLQAKCECNPAWQYTTMYRQEVCDFINTLSWPIFLTIQMHRPSKLLEGDRFASLEEAEKHYRDYFKAYPSDILLDNEVDEHLRTNASQANYAWYVYDSTQTQPEWKVYEVCERIPMIINCKSCKAPSLEFPYIGNQFQWSHPPSDERDTGFTLLLLVGGGEAWVCEACFKTISAGFDLMKSVLKEDTIDVCLYQIEVKKQEKEDVT